MSEWQPIETAPKDGSSILLFTGTGMIEGNWSFGRWDQGVIYATYDGCGGTAFESNPTHWMPLPEPPK